MDYVLVATSDIRETFKKDDRPAFIRNCVKIAAGTWICCQAKTGKAKNNNRKEIKSPALIYNGV